MLSFGVGDPCDVISLRLARHFHVITGGIGSNDAHKLEKTLPCHEPLRDFIWQRLFLTMLRE